MGLSPLSHARLIEAAVNPDVETLKREVTTLEAERHIHKSTDHSRITAAGARIKPRRLSLIDPVALIKAEIVDSPTRWTDTVQSKTLASKLRGMFASIRGWCQKFLRGP